MRTAKPVTDPDAPLTLDQLPGLRLGLQPQPPTYEPKFVITIESAEQRPDYWNLIVRLRLPDEQIVRVLVPPPPTVEKLLDVADGIYYGEERGNSTCGYACGYQEPYGYVPEADCPVHDV